MQDLLSVTLRQVHGADSQLEDWSAHPVSKRGKHRAVRYDLDARLAGAPHTRRYQWVGKFYEHDDDAGRVAAVLRQLSVTNGPARGGLVIPLTIQTVTATKATKITKTMGRKALMTRFMSLR